MRLAAENLEEIYDLLRKLPKPVAVFDFTAGELGSELWGAQYLGKLFYEKWCDEASVVALCWKGCCLIYENVSDIQIELLAKEDSVRGNLTHDCGRSRFRWLKEMGHQTRINEIPGIVGYSPPIDVRTKRLFHDFGVGQTQILEKLIEWYTETQYVFKPLGERLIEGDYIGLFSRNEPDGHWRNTKQWQIELFYSWARRYGLRLVVVADLWPRDLPTDVVHIRPEHRDLDLICNVVHYSRFYATPASGAGELAAVFGCNFVSLGQWPVKGDLHLLGQLVESRGFRYFGVLRESGGRVACEVEKCLMSQS